MSVFVWKTCCNPLDLPPHQPNARDLRPVRPWMVTIQPKLDTKSVICSACRKKLSQIRNSDTTPLLLDVEDQIEVDEMYFDKDIAFNLINECIQYIGEDAFDKRRLSDLCAVKIEKVYVENCRESFLCYY